ncbi:MAG TPA: aminodeoxychorismate lyase [Steroidobacteraceae bacterium]|nr:aminodeoxychorismate lyase [Steroidobacteraceae bacterium]
MSALLAASINGDMTASASLAIEDRGLHYGDGLFETMLVRQRSVVALEVHLQRLADGCSRLGIAPPRAATLKLEIDALLRNVNKHASDTVQVCKLIVTRQGSRGYRGVLGAEGNRLLLLYSHQPAIGPESLTIRWCLTRLARNPALAGMKHLNRLEQILAQQEWQEGDFAEGLMLDMEDELICATAANVFAVIDGVLTTPDLRNSGVRGTMRTRVLNAAQLLDMTSQEGALRSTDLAKASEVFLTNAVRGIRPVVKLDSYRWEVGPLTRKLARALQLW